MMQWKRGLAIAALLGFSGTASGCYLAHVATGQMRLLWARQPVANLLTDPATPPALRDRLNRIEQVRRYAAGLGLDVGGRYSAYSPWPGDFVVTTVVATRPGEVEPVTTWFPIVGSVPYRGYFDAERAAAEAERLRAEGLDVCETQVRAYSTLGWFDDPLTGPMLRQEEPVLVETVFHELMHATVFVPGETDFNEGVAAFIGQEARVRFYADLAGAEGLRRERLAVAQDRRLRAEVLALRQDVAALYASGLPAAERAAGRASLESDARRRIAVLELPDYDPAAWAQRLRLNDACLALSGTYHADTQQLAARLDALEGDLAAFVALVVQAAEEDSPRERLLGPAAALENRSEDASSAPD